MAIPQKFYRLVLKWTLPGGEVAHCTSHWGTPSPETNFAASANLLRIRGLDYWDAIKVGYSPTVLYIGSQLDLLNTNGTIDSGIDNTITGVPGTDAAGNQLPHEVAMVVTTKTAGTGRRDRGRYYLPPPSSVGLDGDTGLFHPTWVDDVADASAQFLTAVAGTGFEVTSVLYSRADDELKILNAVSVGNVPDAQRRRRDALTEVRVTETF